jgi:hypothetical protein
MTVAPITIKIFSTIDTMRFFMQQSNHNHIIICGGHRSGTTFLASELHKVLDQRNGFKEWHILESRSIAKKLRYLLSNYKNLELKYWIYYSYAMMLSVINPGFAYNYFLNRFSEHGKISIDASPSYWASNDLLERLEHNYRNEIVIFIVRDPQARAISHFSRAFAKGKVRLNQSSINKFFASNDFQLRQDYKKLCEFLEIANKYPSFNIIHYDNMSSNVESVLRSILEKFNRKIEYNGNNKVYNSFPKDHVKDFVINNYDATSDYIAYEKIIKIMKK